jgi:hypothetical protein
MWKIIRIEEEEEGNLKSPASLPAATGKNRNRSGVGSNFSF